MTAHRPLKRPLYVVGLTFGLCLYAATVMGYHAALAAALLCGVLFVLALTVRITRRNEGVIAALLAAGSAFSLFAAWEYHTVQPLTSMDGETVQLTLWVEEEVGETENSICCFVRVREGALPQDTRLVLWIRNTPDAPQIYDRVTAEMTLEATDEWRSSNVFLSAWVDECTAELCDERPWSYELQKWRRYILERLETRADGDVAALLRAICFGDKTHLSEDVKDNFAAAGLSHITAVSGFHMSVISLGLFKLLGFLGLRRRWAALLSLPVPALFAALTGFSYSAMRAGVMCTVLLLGAMFRRVSDARNSLGAAVLLLLIFDCAAVYDLGLQLSVAATWGLLLAVSMQSHEKTKWYHKLAHGLQLTVAAVVATLPLSAIAFGQTSALAPLTNLIGQPLASVIVSAGSVGTLLLCVPWLAFLGAPLVLLAGVAAKGLLILSEFAASLPFAFWQLREPYLVLLALSAPFLLLLGWCLLKGRGLRITAMLLVIALCLSTMVSHFGMRGVTSVTAIHIPSGTLVLFERDGHHAAVATGEAAAEDVAYTLALQNVTRLDLLLFVEEEQAMYIGETAVTQLPLRADDAWEKTPFTVNFWNDATLVFHEGWCCFSTGERTVLIAPCDGTVSALPREYRTADAAIFDRVPPRGVELLALSEAILSCDEDELPDVTRSMMWGVYPIEVVDDETKTIKFR